MLHSLALPFIFTRTTSHVKIIIATVFLCFASSLMLPQVVVAACEKYPGKFDVAAKMIKEASLFRLNMTPDVPFAGSFA
jgi:hypothetical protein